MRICDLHTGRILLTRAAKQLRDQWVATSEYWQDLKHSRFEEDHLQPVAPQVTLLLAAVQRLSESLEQMERDCSDEREAE